MVLQHAHKRGRALEQPVCRWRIASGSARLGRIRKTVLAHRLVQYGAELAAFAIRVAQLVSGCPEELAHVVRRQLRLVQCDLDELIVEDLASGRCAVGTDPLNAPGFAVDL